MATEESSTRRPSMTIHNIASSVIILAIGLMLVISWRPIIYPLLVGAITGAPLPIQALPTAMVVPPAARPVPPAARPQVQEAAPVVLPTPYTMATAEAIADEQYHQAVEQAELNSAPLPNDSKVVEQPAAAPAGVNADWCRGSHLSRPECQPGNGSKEER